MIKNNILATNQNKAPSHSVGSYEVLELLGSGAFGSVYKVSGRKITINVNCLLPLPAAREAKKLGMNIVCFLGQKKERGSKFPSDERGG